jgi:ABC-2 type transport system ATP-binding protein
MAERKPPVVQTAGLCKVFKDFWRRPAVEAVKDLNLDIRPGEIFGLLGPNGSGKTTTIKMLLGLLYPTRGRISVFGKSPTDVAVKARIGFLPEESYLYRFLVAHETLDYFGRLFRLPARVRRERTERLLDMVGLRHEARRRVGEYSKGMARRIGLAQALINDPEFLILDEPTSGLDPIGARQIKDVIRELGRKGKTILLSSHILADVEDVCDRVTILYGGQQQAAGDINEILRKEDITQLSLPTVSADTINQIRDLVRRLENKDILDVTHPRVKLEEFFLKIVEEAQAANIRTYGARSGGAIPDFLRKPAETGEDIIESLVSAASPVSRSIAPSAAPLRESVPSGKVIDELLRGREEGESEPVEAASGELHDESHGESSKVETPSKPALQRAADASVIDDLIGGSTGGSRKERS